MGAWLRCLEVAALLLQQLRSVRLPPVPGLDLTVLALLETLIEPAVMHADAAVRCSCRCIVIPPLSLPPRL